MKIISWNVNGLRAVSRKGFLEWVAKTKPDILCLQEIKLGGAQLSLDFLGPKDYRTYLNPAARPGYSGVAVYTKEEPLKVQKNLGLKRFDQEGRMLELSFSNFRLVNLYLPHGGREKENLDYKLKVYAHLLDYLKKIKEKNVLLVGDFNVAHQEIDLARPKQNQNNIMFTPEERKQIDKIIELGFIDTFRKFHQGGGNYTWWSYSFEAKRRNMGWRIDYAFSSKPLAPQLKDAFILSGTEGSDHCPIGVEIRH